MSRVFVATGMLLNDMDSFDDGVIEIVLTVILVRII